MKFKSMLKITLSALLLLVGFSAFAAEDEGSTEPGSGQTENTEEEPAGPEEVQLASGAKISWAKFIGAINNPSSIAGEVDDTELQTAKGKYEAAVEKADAAPGELEQATTALNEANTAYREANDVLQGYKDQQLTMSESQKYTTGPVGWLKTIRTRATDFQTAFNTYTKSLGKTDADALNLSYYVSISAFGNFLFISFSGIPADAGENTWVTGKKVSDFFNAISGKTFDIVSLYLGQTDGKDNYPENDGEYVLTYNNSASTIANTIVTGINTLAKEDGYYETTPTEAYQELLNNIADQTTTVKSLAEAQETAQKDYNEKSAAVSNANALVNTTKAAYEKALEDYNKAVTEAGNAINDYLNVTLLTTINASTAVSKAYSGSINANGNIINVAQGVNLFGTSYFTNGQLHNAIINGVFATGGKYYNVAAWRGANGIYYDEIGNNGGTQTNIGKLAFDNRDLMFFSADIANKKLVKWENKVDVQVYDITMYQANATTQFYTNIAGGKFINNPITTVPVNTLFESKTNDFGDISNVIVDKVCAKLVITDKEQFYCPFDITANAVSYARDFNKGYNSVCLPFDLSYTYGDANSPIKGLLTYDKADPTKFWFIVNDGTVKAYTPMLLNANESFNIAKLDLGGITIKQTPASQMNYVDRGATSSCGLVKGATAQQVADGEDADGKVYGLVKTEEGKPAQFQPAKNSTTSFPALRMVILCPEEPSSSAPMRAPRQIGVLDPNGVEITDEFSGIEEVVVSEVETFSVAGGQCEITITSAANYGKVPVYALDGKLVTVAEVMEGTTTVNVAGGMYIVMGKKVMVK